jgi:hypothetical protein
MGVNLSVMYTVSYLIFLRSKERVSTFKLLKASVLYYSVKLSNNGDSFWSSGITLKGITAEAVLGPLEQHVRYFSLKRIDR